MDLHAWITQQVDQVECLLDENEWPPSQADGVRLRCEADRRILARHRAWPQSDYCDGCDADLTTRLNDCPELLDLAHAHGITPEILAVLDRSQPPEAKPLADQYANGGILTPPITSSDVPEALRGTRWKPHH